MTFINYQIENRVILRYLTYLSDCVRRQLFQTYYFDGTKIALYFQSSSFFIVLFDILPHTVRKKNGVMPEPFNLCLNLFVIVYNSIDEIHHGLAGSENVFHLVHP